MFAWFTSLNGAITLSLIAFLTMMARLTFLDALYVPEIRTMLPENQPVTIAVVMVVFMVFVGSWLGFLLAAARGSRTGLIASLIYCLFVALGGGLLTLLFLCPAGCAAPPIGNIIVWANLVTGLVASVMLFIQCRHTPGQPKIMRRAANGETS